MTTITFENVTPRVFQNAECPESDIWQSLATFERGKLYLVEAESGKGKSTFCSYILGYRNDYTGKVMFDGEDIKAYSTSRWTEIRQRHVSHLFQELRLFPELTAMENVQIKNQLTGHKDMKTICSWFERLGIENKIDTKVRLMSFGQQQRVAMMRALAQPFDVLLADEPISHLDDRNSSIMGEIMMEEAKRQDACVIITSIGKHMSLDYDKVYKL
ncbi:MAG: ATP-binding cassette domain-containing protein [Prevotella sp.]|nr:ATP-binding cassette domain-containing protein [Prevotella sp.]